MELSFTDCDSIIAIVEGVLDVSLPTDSSPLQLPFPKVIYAEAMSRYGCDKPDTRFSQKLRDISQIVIANEKMRKDVPMNQFSTLAIVAKSPTGNPKNYNPQCKFTVNVKLDNWTDSSIVGCEKRHRSRRV